MVSENNEPADLAGFRARREELKREHRRKKARDNFTPYAPDYGREIPPRLNPDVPDMVDRGQSQYVDLTHWLMGTGVSVSASGRLTCGNVSVWDGGPRKTITVF
jgi:hypothetical protein